MKLKNFKLAMKVVHFIIKGLLFIVFSCLVLELALQGAHWIHAAMEPASELPHPGTPVILCVGDSHTYGVKLPAEQSYPGQLQSLFDHQGIVVNVVNAGVPGENTSELRRRLPELLVRYRPVAVVILSCSNNGWNRADIIWSDLQDGVLQPGIRSWPRRLWFGLVGNLRTVRLLTYLWNETGRRLKPLERVEDREGKVYFHREQWKWKGPWNELDRMLDRSRRDLAAMVEMAESVRALPILMTYAGQPFSPMGGANDVLRTMAKSLGVPLVDNDAAIWPRFMRPDGSMDQAAHDRLFLADSGETHLAGPGYAIVARNVFETLVQLRAVKP